jgi:hypothetical protein
VIVTPTGVLAPANQALHRDRGRILFSRDTTPLQRPRWLSLALNKTAKRGGKGRVAVTATGRWHVSHASALAARRAA